MKGTGRRIWIARILIALVFVINVQCALQFVFWPSAYTNAYQIEGSSAETVMRSIGICFLMWNTTYPPVVIFPQRYRVLFGVVITQQLIGLIGESTLLLTLDTGLETLALSITRFIIFDGIGLALLICAFLVSARQHE